MPEPGPTIFAAGLVLPVSAPAIREGAVLVRDGRIAAVGGLEDLGQQNADAELRYYPHYTIVPGAVNTHAHLGFRRGDAPEGGSFSKWLAGLIERLPEKEKWTAEAARASAREAIEAGTTVFAEFFPHEIGTPAEAVEFIVNKVRELRDGLPERMDAQVSVHSPYTVDPESSRLAARRTRELGWRVAIHL